MRGSVGAMVTVGAISALTNAGAQALPLRGLGGEGAVDSAGTIGSVGAIGVMGTVGSMGLM